MQNNTYIVIIGKALKKFNFLGFYCVEVLSDWALPTVVQKGDKVDLRCNFELSGENMYSLKWYRDNVELYRYIPSGGFDMQHEIVRLQIKSLFF